MIEHDLGIGIDASNRAVWAYVSDMSNWASAMPGYRSFELLEGRDSLWILKVGVGALVKTVKVIVKIDAWDEPDHVAFTYRLDNDPVNGSGTYRATQKIDGGTEIALHVVINGQGPMAPAWEAMARPILPKFAKSFAETLKSKIEAIASQDSTTGLQHINPVPLPPEPEVPLSFVARLYQWLRLWLVQKGRID